MAQLDIDLDQMGKPEIGSNALGIAGFITSVLGLLTGGCLSPIGLLLSLIALFRAPRGFAIAGTIIGFVGSLGFIILGFVLGAVVLLLTAGGLDGLNTVARFKEVGEAVVDHREYTGAFPASLDQLQPGELSSYEITDPWGTPIEYTLVNDGAGFALTSAGPDRALATSDDYSFTFDGNTIRVILNGEEHEIEGLGQIIKNR